MVGNSTELKNAILFDGVQASHYNRRFDLGYKAHLGAGAITSNIKGDNPRGENAGELMETGLRKFGAVVGDLWRWLQRRVKPGTVIGE